MRITTCFLLLALLPVAARAANAEPVDYLRDVKPILERSCAHCHGTETEESGLRLDTLGWALSGGNRGPAIVPRNSAASPLIQALNGTNDLERMPADGAALDPAEIATIASWIDQGAAAPDTELTRPPRHVVSDHWSFKPLQPGSVPSVQNAGWVRNPIDAYVLAKLESAGLTPSAEAEKSTLIRRLSFDLLGLPPTPAEVEAFLLDNSPDAYERLVDRFLESPHYGERWGRHWLDLARYADSNGYTIDSARTIWKYRDWVLDALNRDLPFDQFTIEQIAGDMLPAATLEQRIATGFHRNTLRNEEGGTDPEQFRVEAVVDRVSTTGSVFLGLTLGCARCHDHKYDPISQREFYQFFDLLNGADEPDLPVPTTQQAKEQPALLAEIAEAEKRLGMVDMNSGKRLVEWEQQFAGRLDVPWITLDPMEASAASGATLTRQPDASLLAGGPANAPETYTLQAASPLDCITGLRIEALTDDSLPQRGPGRADNGNFVLHEISLAVTNPAQAAAGAVPQPLAWSGALADHSQEKFPVGDAIDGKPETGWAINVNSGSLNVDRRAVFITKEDTNCSQGKLLITLVQHDPKYSLGRFRISVTRAPRDVLALPDSVRQIFAIAADARTAEQKQLLLEEFRKVDKERLPIAGKVAELKLRQEQLAASITTTMVMQERTEPRTTHIHLKGDFLRPGALVQGAVPAVLPQLVSAGDKPNRLDLARWLVSPQNPLTPRVTVNRLWQQYFDQGIVTTENDFGTQGSEPSHPELLDYLASEFIARNWSLKALHRLIVTSATYRQASLHRSDLATHDPYNRLLGRQARIRLEAEVIRDACLAACGLLAPEIGGPGVYPPQPEGIYRFTQNVKYWAISQGADRYRRGMYTFLWRSSPDPFLATFDAPMANVTCTRRVRSNTPLQALTLANDQAFFEFAQALGLRVIQQSPSPADDARLRYAFHLCLSREPSLRELQRLSDYLLRQRSQYTADDASAQSVAGAKRPAEIPAAEAAAWISVARVLLNLDEFITRE